LAHIFVFDSQTFYDAHWDAGHLFVLLSYFFPIFGIWGEFVKLHKNSLLKVIELEKETFERKRAEKSVRESEERLSFYTNNSPMAVVEWDSDFVVTKWTGESEKMFGWSAEETIGKPMMDLNMIFESDIPIVQNTMEKLTNGLNKQVVSTNHNYRKDKSIITCEWYNTILKDENGKMHSVLSQVLDITERKQIELKIQQQNNELKKLNTDKDRFIRILGHDLKSPFNNLLGLSELLTKNIHTYDIDKIENLATNINKSAQRSFNLLDDLLMWAGAQQGSIVFKPQTLSLTDVCT
jgi:PAS domain S-box-containing protein